MPLQNIGPVENFPVGKGVRIEIDGKTLAVFNTTGQYYAIDDACPGNGGSFSEGSVSGTTVTSPDGKVSCDVRLGSCTPSSAGDVESYDVSCDSMSLFVDVG